MEQISFDSTDATPNERSCGGFCVEFRAYSDEIKVDTVVARYKEIPGLERAPQHRPPSHEDSSDFHHESANTPQLGRNNE